MSRKIKEAIDRVEAEISIAHSATMGTQYAQFLEDLSLLVGYVKRAERKKRV
jgi:hypothetical protein